MQIKKTAQVVKKEPAEPRSKKATRPASRRSLSTHAASTRLVATGVPEGSEFFGSKSKLIGNLRVNLDGEILALTHLDKVYWPDQAYTKGDLLRYYFSMAEYVLPYLKNRPLILKRYPEGIARPFFYQHDLKDSPKFLNVESIRSSDGTMVNYAVVNDLASLLYIGNLGTIAQNPFHSRRDHLDCPDYFIFDLDPEKGATFRSICDLALTLKEMLKELGLESYAKTSGSTGIHVYVPIKRSYSYAEIVPIAKEIARRVVEKMPAVATIERRTHNRKVRQVYIDYLQNIEGKSVASAYSVREKPLAPVSTPLDWSELRKLNSVEDFTILNVARRVKKKGDLFKRVLEGSQTLTVARNILGIL